MAVFWSCSKCSACISRNVHSGNHSLTDVCGLTDTTYFSCKHLCLRVDHGHFLLEQSCSSLNGEPCHHTNARVLFLGNGIPCRSICTVWCLSLRSVLVFISTRNRVIYPTTQIIICLLYAKSYNHRSTDYFGDSTTYKRSPHHPR